MKITFYKRKPLGTSSVRYTHFFHNCFLNLLHHLFHSESLFFKENFYYRKISNMKKVMCCVVLMVKCITMFHKTYQPMPKFASYVLSCTSPFNIISNKFKRSHHYSLSYKCIWFLSLSNGVSSFFFLLT